MAAAERCKHVSRRVRAHRELDVPDALPHARTLSMQRDDGGVKLSPEARGANGAADERRGAREHDLDEAAVQDRRRQLLDLVLDGPQPCNFRARQFVSMVRCGTSA